MNITPSTEGASPLLVPDYNEARRLLAALDPDPNALFGFRTFDDRGVDPRLAVKAYGTLDSGIRQSNNPAKDGKPCSPGRLLAFMQPKGAGCFFVPNRLDGQGQLKRNVVGIRALYVDADHRPEVERLHAFIAATRLTPTAIVASGGVHEGAEKLQCYWRVRGCPVAEFTKAQLTLVSRIGTDPAVQDAGRLLRLCGYWHLKREPRETRIVSLDPAVEYEFREFMARVLAQPQICDPWASGKGAWHSTQRRTASVQAALPVAGPRARLRVLLDRYGGLITPAVRALLRETVAPSEGAAGNRHATLVTTIARCMEAGWRDDDIRALILPVVNAEWGDGDWSRHIDSIIHWTRAQEVAALAAAPATPRSLAMAFGAGAAR